MTTAVLPRGGYATTSGFSDTLYIGIGAGVGGVLVITILYVSLRIYGKRKEHKRAMAALEQRHLVRAGLNNEIAEVPRPVSLPRGHGLLPYHVAAGWGALSSNEEVQASEPSTLSRAGKRLSSAFSIGDNGTKRTSVSVPKQARTRGIRLKRMKKAAHLSAIIESPRSRATAASPGPHFDERSQNGAMEPSEGTRQPKRMSYTTPADADIFRCPGSPELGARPSFALRRQTLLADSEGSTNLLTGIDTPKAIRSRSMGTFLGPLPHNAMFGHTCRLSRPQMHARSLSLGNPTLPPAGPVPPLPASAFRDQRCQAPGIDRSLSRLSNSSQGSAGSSVLTSPALRLGDDAKPPSSPTVEEVVAADKDARLNQGASRQWQSPLIAGPRPMGINRKNELELFRRSQGSVRSNIVRYSTDSLASNRLSGASVASSIESNHNRLSIPQLKTADRISISRVSSFGSLRSKGEIQVLNTPRRPSRSTVSVYGSPAERKKTSVLQDISGNASTPSRQASNSTQTSSRSSNGNPFQWDGPMQKPSALKGSPNARKGHRRQNCVRISTLTPQVLGPSLSRPTTPSFMQGIAEESPEQDEPQKPPGMTSATKRGLARPPSASTFEPHMRLNPTTLRASLTPSSPTLSTFKFNNDESMSRDVSDTHLAVSPSGRSKSRLSNASSLFSIPSFPSPSKTTLSGIDQEMPTPVFCLSRPSTDLDEESSSPFDLHASSDPPMPSSPPVDITTGGMQEYDPAWPMLTLPVPEGSNEYDPASPALDYGTPQESSPTFPFATNRESPLGVSPTSRPDSYGGHPPDTPPISPKTIPEGFQAFFANTGPTIAKVSAALTSANASPMLADLPNGLPPVTFPGAPSLPPPQSGSLSSRNRSESNALNLQPMRPAPPPPINSEDMPSPLHLTSQNPQGPRSEPAKGILKNVMALRRMNSEANDSFGRESRRYTRLGREPSPLLPFIGSPDPADGCNDLFDFDFASATEATEGGAERDSLEKVDMADIERRLERSLSSFAPNEDCQRSSSVWEDGEKYWDNMPQYFATAESPVADSSPTTRKLQSIPEFGRLTTTPIPKLKMYGPEIILDGTLGVGTPGSLYDANGFLKSEL